MEIPFIPSRVILQDFTGVPAVVLAALRNAMVDLGGDQKVNPLVPVSLVIDHSVQVDVYHPCHRATWRLNTSRGTLRVSQMGTGKLITSAPSHRTWHRSPVNLEWIAKCAGYSEEGGERTYFPDSLVGTTPYHHDNTGVWMGGNIEAEAVMLGQPIYMLAPDVVGR